MPPSTASPWSSRASRGRPGCQPTRCCTGPSRRRPASAAARGSKETGWAPARRPRKPRTGRMPSSTSTGRTPRCRSPPPMRCGTAASRTPPAASSWSRSPAPARPMNWDSSPSTLTPAPPPSPNATPGGGRSSRRTRPGSRLLGVGDACNRVEKAVERTVPFGFLIQTLLILWYARFAYYPADVGRRRRLCPWYRTKTGPSPADMLARLRREFLEARISAIQPGQDASDQIDLDAWTCDSTAA